MSESESREAVEVFKLSEELSELEDLVSSMFALSAAIVVRDP